MRKKKQAKPVEPKRYYVVGAVNRWNSLEVPIPGFNGVIRLQQPTGSECVGFLKVYENEEAARLENPNRKLFIMEEVL